MEITKEFFDEKIREIFNGVRLDEDVIRSIEKGMHNMGCPKLIELSRTENLEIEQIFPRVLGLRVFSSYCVSCSESNHHLLGKYVDLFKRVTAGSNDCETCWTFQYYVALNAIENNLSYWKLWLED